MSGNVINELHINFEDVVHENKAIVHFVGSAANQDADELAA